MAGELTEVDLRRIAREEADKRHEEREAEKLTITDDNEGHEKEPTDGNEYPCPNCEYVAKEQFDVCPKCGAGKDKPIEWTPAPE